MFYKNRHQQPTALEATETLLDHEKGGNEQTSSKRKATIKHIGLQVLLAIITLGLGAVFLYWTRSTSSSAKWDSCGNDTTTARERGCSFDILSFSWQTPECYDAESIDIFLKWKDWEWYTDKNLTVPISMEEVMLGERTVYVTFEYHMVHCTFAYRQMHRAYETGWIDSHLRAYEHTKHCQSGLLSSLGRPYLPQKTLAEIIYPRCERIGSKTLSSYKSVHSYP